MKPKLSLHIFLFFLTVFIYGQTPTFQVTKGIDDLHFHDLNIELIDDGTNDFIVAGNLFDPSMQNYDPFLMRVDQAGNVMWFMDYMAPEMEKARCFDIVVHGDIIAMTGSADITGIHKMFIAEFNASGGTSLNSKYYDIVDPDYHGRGLHIITTESGDLGPGYAVGGFISDMYPFSPGNSNFGFVVRTDAMLNPFWNAIINTNVTGANIDFDMVNHITETPTGFFLTGGATTLTSSAAIVQGILAHKIDFIGTFMWDSSYVNVTANMNNLSVDAYYDTAIQKLFMLCNYEHTAYFGNTTIDDSTGAIDLTRSWLATDTDNPDKYGFSIRNSVLTSNNLLISGYDRDETWVDNDGVTQNGQSNIFLYEFDMNSGVIQPPTIQYLVPHVEPQPDEFNFWNIQMPVIYYPEITSLSSDMVNYYHVGYRTRNSVNFTEVELVKTKGDKLNDCENLNFSPTILALEYFAAVVFSHIEDVMAESIVFVENPLPHNVYTCDPGIGVDESELSSLQLFPNPTKDYLYVEVTQNITFYKITDSLGRVLLQDVLQEGTPIDVKNLKSSIYIIEFYDKNNLITTQKFIKY